MVISNDIHLAEVLKKFILIRCIHQSKLVGQRRWLCHKRIRISENPLGNINERSSPTNREWVSASLCNQQALGFGVDVGWTCMPKGIHGVHYGQYIFLQLRQILKVCNRTRCLRTRAHGGCLEPLSGEPWDSKVAQPVVLSSMPPTFFKFELQKF